LFIDPFNLAITKLKEQLMKTTKKILARMKTAGTGISTVCNLFGVNKRHGSHLLHAFASEILEGREIKSSSKEITGEIEVDHTPQLSGNDPRNVEGSIWGVVGATIVREVEVSLKELSRASKMPLSVMNEDKDSFSDLASALTQNIYKNILVNMEEEELDEVLGEVLYETGEVGYETTYSSMDTWSFVILSIKYSRGSFRVVLESEATYDLVCVEDHSELEP
jgi:hypothetical protein